MALEIDGRLLDPSSQMEIIENLNRILKLIDAGKSDIAALAERVTALEGAGA